MKSYRDLIVYKQSKDLAIKVHALSLKLPKFEMYEEGSQIRRSSKAVTTMIVEGYGRRYKADFIKHLVYAHVECDETITHLEFLMETKSLEKTELVIQLQSDYVALSRSIYKFIKWVEANFDSNNLVKEPEMEIWNFEK